MLTESEQKQMGISFFEETNYLINNNSNMFLLNIKTMEEKPVSVPFDCNNITSISEDYGGYIFVIDYRTVYYCEIRWEKQSVFKLFETQKDIEDIHLNKEYNELYIECITKNGNNSDYIEKITICILIVDIGKEKSHDLITYLIPKDQVYICGISGTGLFLNMHDKHSKYIEDLNLFRVHFDPQIKYNKCFITKELFHDQSLAVVLISNDCICSYVDSCSKDDRMKYIYNLDEWNISIRDIHKVWILKKLCYYVHFVQTNNGTIYVCNLNKEKPILFDTISGFTVDMNIEIVSRYKSAGINGGSIHKYKEEFMKFADQIHDEYFIINKMYTYKYTLYNEKSQNYEMESLGNKIVLLKDELSLSSFNGVVLNKIKLSKNIIKYCYLNMRETNEIYYIMQQENQLLQVTNIFDF